VGAAGRLGPPGRGRPWYNRPLAKEHVMIGPEIYQRIDRLEEQLTHLRGYL